jgi:hypothetical protein
MLFRKEPLVQLKSIVTFAVPNGKRPIGKLNLPKRVLNLWVKTAIIVHNVCLMGLEKEIS